MNMKLLILSILAILGVLILSVLFLQNRASLPSVARINAPDWTYKAPILGGFGMDTDERVQKAASNGVQVTVNYNLIPSEHDAYGQELTALHVKVIDGYLSGELAAYECHRTWTVKPPPHGQNTYCKDDYNPHLKDENALLKDITDHLLHVENNQLVIGYWTLDDWPSWDVGGARKILMDIHHLIQRYTPGRPSICGFGALLESNGAFAWSDRLAENFSPQGCDAVGLYVYVRELPNTTPTPPSDAYQWTMSSLLPTMFNSLKQRGWNIGQEPLIGIGQAFGGAIAHTGAYSVTPSAKDIELQSRSFCEQGATGLTFYAWDDSGFGPSSHTPMNSEEIQIGIRNGIAACKRIWSTHGSP